MGDAEYDHMSHYVLVEAITKFGRTLPFELRLTPHVTHHATMEDSNHTINNPQAQVMFFTVAFQPQFACR